MSDFSNLIIRWTFGETKERPTSLQAFDMLECSISYAQILFPNAKKYVVFNSLKCKRSLELLERIALNKVELIEAKSNWNNSTKNSFWKYKPLRIDRTKYEMILDSDIIFWNIPKTVRKWLNSDGLLINSDWNGQNYGDYNGLINSSQSINAGIIGYPPCYKFDIPDVMRLKERFLTEQGFITNQFITSKLKLNILSKNEIFQSNAEEYIDKKIQNIIKKYSGAHFCGCNYCHYQHWDKFYKDDLWKQYNLITNEAILNN